MSSVTEGLRPAKFYEKPMPKVGHASACQPAGRPGFFDPVAQAFGPRNFMENLVRHRGFPDARVVFRLCLSAVARGITESCGAANPGCSRLLAGFQSSGIGIS